MTNKMLTQARLKELLYYNKETGEFKWLVSRCCVKAGNVAGSVSVFGYCDIRLDYKIYKAHRLAWLYSHGCWPKFQLDHIDGNRLNNRISNLRECTNSENAQNRKSRERSSSKYIGVYKTKKTKKFVAQITVNGNQKHLGYFETEKLAYLAYCEAKKKLHSFNPVQQTEKPVAG